MERKTTSNNRNKTRFLWIAIPILIVIIGVIVFFITSNQNAVISNRTTNNGTSNVTEVNNTSDINSTEIQPTIYSNRLVSPPLVEGNDIYELTVPIPDNWKVSDSKFFNHSQGIYQYYISLVSRDSSYMIYINQGDGSPSHCLFSPYDQSKENLPLYVKFGEYQTLQTDFGEVRMTGSGEYEEPGKTIFTFCQEISGDEPKQWISQTRIGSIALELPENFDENVLEEMKEIIRRIEYTKI